jgi:hypothetical protein
MSGLLAGVNPCAESGIMGNPSRCGLLSLVAAVLAWGSWPLVTVVGPLIVGITVPLVFVSVVAGLVGIVKGFQQRHATGVIAGLVGVSLVCLGAIIAATAIMNF